MVASPLYCGQVVEPPDHRFSNDAHRAALAECLDALDARRPPSNNGRAALAVHDLIDAVLVSSQVQAPIPVRQRPRS